MCVGVCAFPFPQLFLCHKFVQKSLPLSSSHFPQQLSPPSPKSTQKMKEEEKVRLRPERKFNWESGGRKEGRGKAKEKEGEREREDVFC